MSIAKKPSTMKSNATKVEDSNKSDSKAITIGIDKQLKTARQIMNTSHQNLNMSLYLIMNLE